MKQSRFNEEQIIEILKLQAAGMTTTEVCRRYGISSATFFKWTWKLGGLEVSKALRLRTLEGDSSRLKKLLRDLQRQRTSRSPSWRAEAGIVHTPTNGAAGRSKPALVARLRL
jgi:putative transposase